MLKKKKRASSSSSSIHLRFTFFTCVRVVCICVRERALVVCSKITKQKKKNVLFAGYIINVNTFLFVTGWVVPLKMKRKEKNILFLELDNKSRKCQMIITTAVRMIITYRAWETPKISRCCVLIDSQLEIRARGGVAWYELLGLRATFPLCATAI